MAQKVSKARQNTYASYKAASKWKSNREAKLRKLMKSNPNNLQIATALKNVSYRRYTPKSKFWSKSMKSTAMILKEFCGRCPHAVFNSNPVVASEALRTLSNVSNLVLRSKNHVSFSIKDRAKIK